MPSINLVILGGYCVDEPRLFGEHGSAVVFRLRMRELVKPNAGKAFVKTDYVTIKAFGRAALSVGTYVSDGIGVLVTGRLKTERWGPEGDRKKEMLVVADEVKPSGMSEAEELESFGLDPDTPATSEDGAQERSELDERNSYGPASDPTGDHVEELNDARDPAGRLQSYGMQPVPWD